MIRKRIVLSESERRPDLYAEYPRHMALATGAPAKHLVLFLTRRAIAAEEECAELRADAKQLRNKLIDARIQIGEFWEEAEQTQLTPFGAILDELRELHDKKSADYGTDEDALANIRASEKFDIPAWLGAILRGHDKIVRLQSFARKGRLENESVEDSLRDLAVYAIIALQLYREKANAKYHEAEAGLSESGGDTVGEGELSEAA